MSESLKLSGRSLRYLTLLINSTSAQEINQSLEDRAGKSTQGMPVVLDSTEPLQLGKLLVMVRDAGLQPIGVHEGPLAAQAPQFKLAVIPKRAQSLPEQLQDTAKSAAKPSPAASSATAPHTAESKAKSSAESASPTKVFNDVMRSGQVVGHEDGDLMILADVNSGAEAIAGGSLHIYGRGQGRLIAGTSGNENASIFCLNLQPTLISIAGTFCLKDQIPADALGKAVHVTLDSDLNLVFTPMKTQLQLNVNPSTNSQNK